MRLIYTVGLVIAVILCVRTTAHSANENETKGNIVDSRYTGGGRLLRRVDYDSLDDDGMDEERAFDIKNIASKLNPISAVKKSAAQAAKAKKTLKEAVDYQKMIDRANKLISE
ncbi:hypothetical protein PHMEG_00039581 [Phytophthora megakarya]|uniref:RxLR effector protein n=1 Tax=Phytophthora megakarya TaxID=4795 RepID=A0A225UF78_9STRA|nr:hypothetical protein PHMEG_00039581 [Phytophthora megakarya]